MSNFEGIITDYLDGPYRDGSDAYAKNHNYFIYFTHVATDGKVNFKAFLTDYEDQYASSWRDETVYGRMDPISTFQGTTRQISFSFDVVAASAEEALINYTKSKTLIKFLYPVYGDIVGEQVSATSIQAPPLLKVRFVNLISEASFDSNGRVIESLPLVGKLSGLNYRPDFEAGFFEGYDMVLPKVNRFSCNYTVFHTQDLGFRQIGSGDADGESTGVPKPGRDAEKASVKNRTNLFGGDPLGEALAQAEGALAQVGAALGITGAGAILEGNLPTGIRKAAAGGTGIPPIDRVAETASTAGSSDQGEPLHGLLSGIS